MQLNTPIFQLKYRSIFQKLHTVFDLPLHSASCLRWFVLARKISFHTKDRYDLASAKILKVVVAPVWVHEDRTFFQTTLASQSPKIPICIWRSAWTSLPANYGIWIRKSVTNICYYTSYWQV